MRFQDLCDSSALIDKQQVLAEPGYVIKYSNAKGEMFILNAQDVADFICFLKENYKTVHDEWLTVQSRKSSISEYEEKSYRAIFGVASSDANLKAISSTGRSQTKPLTRVISKFICFLGKFEYVDVDENSYFDLDSISAAVANIPKNIENLDDAFVVSKTQSDVAPPQLSGFKRLAKPLILLAGISGTGKTRYVREQAQVTGNLNDTYCLVPVRPDWHEPSDLLGYISRLGAEGPRYVVTGILRFIVDAWKEVVAEVVVRNGQREWIGRDFADIRPFWLCLDEMNLAPVEQYFADFLSILETREFLNEEDLQQSNSDKGIERSYAYTSDPILKQEVFAQLDKGGVDRLRTDLGLSDAPFDELWEYFRDAGIQLPFNLIVAGTVNMDETTHGFSRKVIDRALTVDFGEFFPNDFNQFFDEQAEPVTLSYPLLSSVCREDLKEVPSDPDGSKTVSFLRDVNAVLKGSPFELAYRALNELLLSVISQRPKDSNELMAVWDDFLMMKVLPRIEGDQEKLAVFSNVDSVDMGSQDILGVLDSHLEAALASIWEEGRPDLLRVSVHEGGALSVGCRSKAKIKWMHRRLQANGYTSFWP